MAIVRDYLDRRSRSSNRRRVAEALALAFGGTALVCASTIAVSGTYAGLHIAAAISGPVALVLAACHYRRQRLTIERLAHRIDDERGTCDLLRTAIALEAEPERMPTGLEPLVLDEATVLLAELPDSARLRRGPFLLAAFGAVASTLAVLATVATSTPAASVSVEQPDPELRRAIAAASEELRAVAAQPYLSHEARQLLAAASSALDEAAAAEATRESSLADLARAEAAASRLSELIQKMGLLDRKKLTRLSTDQIDRALGKAIANADGARARELGRARVQRSLATFGDPALAQQVAERLVGDISEAGPEQGTSARLDSAREQIQRARARQLGSTRSQQASHGAQDGPAPSKAASARASHGVPQNPAGQARNPAGAGADGEQPSSSTAGGTTANPGLLAQMLLEAGRDNSGQPGADVPGESPQSVAADVQRVEVTPTSAGGAMRVVRGESAPTPGGAADYVAAKRRYAGIAEAAIRQPPIPLSRRDYIRDYFETVREQR